MTKIKTLPYITHTHTHTLGLNSMSLKMHIHSSSSSSSSQKMSKKGDPIQWTIKKVLGGPEVALDRMFKFTRAEAEHVLSGIGSDMVDMVKGGQTLRVKMVDTDTDTWHELSFRKVRRGTVFGFKLGWVSHFVVRRRLRAGDMVGMFVDPNSSVFYFCVLSRANSVLEN